MQRFEPTTLRELRLSVADMYDASDDEAVHLRAANLAAVVRLTPYTMLANIGCGLLVLSSFAPDIPAGLWVWYAALMLVCLFALHAWWRTRHHAFVTASSKSVHRATAHALVLSGLWAVMTLLWFPSGTQEQQMGIATLVTGMIGAGGFVLNPLPYASLVYVLIYTLSALGALWLANKGAYVSVAFLLCLYSPTVMIGSLSAWRKAAALRHAQVHARRQEQMLAVLLSDFEQNSGDALWETDVHGQLRHVSSRLQELLDLQPGEAAQNVFQLLAARHCESREQLRAAMQASRPFKGLVLSMQCRHGEVHLSVNGKSLLSDAGEWMGWRGVISDVTDKVRSNNLLRQLAHTDSLTGLTNRFMLREQLTSLLIQKQPMVLLTIDLDRFKTVNDRHGHSVGDEVLKAVANRLLHTVADGAMVARLGGDEFAVALQTDCTVAQATAMGQSIVDALAENMQTPLRTLRVSCSVGIAISTGEALTIDDLMLQADIALYAAKDAGRGRWVLYTAELGALSRRRSTIERSLLHAIERGELALHWQPKVAIADWQVTGAEALMRWTHPVLGPISPAEFIPIAEQCGMINPLGQWALREACRVYDTGFAGLTIAVNVSSIQLRDSHFVAQLQDVLAAFQMRPQCLELELTESVFVEEAEQALGALHAIRQLGVRLALDDFGTGYSSLSYLRRFSFDTLKIDRAFVTEMLVKTDVQAIVGTMANLADTLGMCTVCEGVETEAQLNAVRVAGCDEIQGFLVSTPLPLDAFIALRRSWPNKPDKPLARLSGNAQQSA